MPPSVLINMTQKRTEKNTTDLQPVTGNERNTLWRQIISYFFSQRSPSIKLYASFSLRRMKWPEGTHNSASCSQPFNVVGFTGPCLLKFYINIWCKEEERAWVYLYHSRNRKSEIAFRFNCCFKVRLRRWYLCWRLGCVCASYIATCRLEERKDYFKFDRVK